MKKPRERIIEVSAAYCEAVGLSRGRVSDLVLHRGGKLQSLADGGDVLTETYWRVMDWFAENWPEHEAEPDELVKWRMERAGDVTYPPQSTTHSEQAEV